MSGLYSTVSSSNTSEMFAERARAIAAERAALGNSILAEVHYGKYSSGLNSDVFTCKDGCDDGRISFGEKISNFCNGLISPIKTMFSSPKNMAITALTVAAGAGLIAITGGAAAPVMVALGVIGGGTQIATGLYKQATATTDAQAAQAWNQMGSGTFAIGTSAMGAKSALKTAGVQNTANMSTWTAITQCLKDAPKYFSTSCSKLSAFFNGSTTAGTTIPRLPEILEKLNPKNKKGAPKANPTGSETKPKVIELPEGQKRLGLPAPKVTDTPINTNQTPNIVEPSETPTRLGLPAPKVYHKPNNSTPLPRVIELPGPTETTALTITEPKVQAQNPSTNISNNTNPIKMFANKIISAVKSGLEFFGLFKD